jgi:hypothetical protein
VCTELAATKQAMHDTAALHHELQLLRSCLQGWHSAVWHDTRERWVEGFRLQYGIQRTPPVRPSVLAVLCNKLCASYPAV